MGSLDKHLLWLVSGQILQLLCIDSTATNICQNENISLSSSEFGADKPRIISTASSYFMPASINAMATSTGALPKPATQWTAMHGGLLTVALWPPLSAPPAELLRAWLGDDGLLPPPLADDCFPDSVGKSLNLSWIKFSQSSMTFCGGGVPSSNAQSWTDKPACSIRLAEYVDSHTRTTSVTRRLFSSCFKKPSLKSYNNFVCLPRYMNSKWPL